MTKLYYKRWLKRAEEVASCSTDTSTKVGAIIINTKTNSLLSSGYNRFCEGVQITPDRLERPTKYFYTEHAERRAIYLAARYGIVLNDSEIIVTHFPCADCARAIICSGIKIVAYPKGVVLSTFLVSSYTARRMLEESGVKIVEL